MFTGSFVLFRLEYSSPGNRVGPIARTRLDQHHTRPAIESVSVLTDGRTSFGRIIDRFESAKKSITISMFIWRDDPTGNRVGQALLDAAARGVEVIITKDKLGAIFELGEENRQSFFHKDYGFSTAIKQRVINAYSSKPDFFSWVRQRPNELVERMREHSKITIFDSVVRNDHSKYVIVDNQTLFIGGVNFEERAASTDANGIRWHDYLLECHGKEFVRNLVDRLSGACRNQSSFEFVLNDRARPTRYEIRPCILGLLKNARQYCYIEMAYVGDPEITDAIVAAAQRGVDVHVILPAWANIQNERNLKTMRGLFHRTAGEASIYLSGDMLHSKMMDVDGLDILIGSANFNERGLNSFAELNVLMSGKSECTQAIRETFLERRQASRKVRDIGELDYRVIKEWCEYVFG